jgi:hypothetical protein
MKTYYDNEYVRSHCMSWSTGRGFVFQTKGETLRPYPTTASRDWIPPVHTSGVTLSLALGVLNAEWLDAMYSDLPSMGDLTKEQVDYISKSSDGIRKLHALMTEHVRNQLRSFMRELAEPPRS